MFIEEFKIPYAAVDAQLIIQFPRLLEFIMEASLLHTEASGIPLSWFMENNKGWIINNYKIELERYPKWKEKIQIATWPSSKIGFVSERSFSLRDENNIEFGRVQTQWLLLDLLKKKPVRISNELVKAYGEMRDPVAVKDLSSISDHAFIVLDQIGYTISPLDIDTNGHVNNTKYISWAFDVHNITEKPKHIFIRYNKECFEGERVLIELAEDRDNNKAIFIKKPDGEKACEIIFTC